MAILRRCPETPIAAVVANSGDSPRSVLPQLKTKKAGGKERWLGFNAITNGIADLKEAGIVDPLKVVKTAFVNAVSVASNYLVIGAAMTELPEKKGRSE